MARQFSGICGLVSGRVGNVVYCIKNDKNYVRNRPRPTTKKPTLKQVAQREKFGVIMGFISPIAKLINESFARYNRRKIGTNVLTKELYKNALIRKGGNWAIDFPRAQIIKGFLPLPSVTMEYETDKQRLVFGWNVSKYLEYLKDEFVILLYVPETGDWVCTESNVCRQDKKSALNLAESLIGRTMHAWVFFRDQAREKFSSSLYLGEVFTVKSSCHEK